MEPCLFRHGKGREPRPYTVAIPVLQWSHVFSDMVRGGAGMTSLHTLLASMEPCLFRHGKRNKYYAYIVCSRGFNGAMSFQTW